MQEKKQKRSIGQCKCCRLHFFDDCGNEELCEHCSLFIADYTKQVRKEVLGDLMNMLGDRAELIDCGGVAEFMFTTYDLTMCVEEILGEEVKQNEK